MIFRKLDDKLFEVNLSNANEDEFLQKQSNPDLFLKIDEDDLPKLPENEHRNFSKIFYKLDNNQVVIDWDRTEEQWKEDKYKEIRCFIYKYYPQEKQNSDLSDKVFFETILKAKKFENIEERLVNAIIEYLNGKDIDQIIEENNISEEDKEPIKQLIKLGIRINWVQDCKKELFKAIYEKREPNYPNYPL